MRGYLDRNDVRPRGDTLLGQRPVVVEVVDGGGEHVACVADADFRDLARLRMRGREEGEEVRW